MTNTRKARSHTSETPASARARRGTVYALARQMGEDTGLDKYTIMEVVESVITGEVTLTSPLTFAATF